MLHDDTLEAMKKGGGGAAGGSGTVDKGPGSKGSVLEVDQWGSPTLEEITVQWVHAVTNSVI